MAIKTEQPCVSLIKIKSTEYIPSIVQVAVDGVIQNNVTGLVIEYAPDKMPQAYITYNAISDVDGFMKVISTFDTDSIREAIKFLSLQLQFDEDLRDAWIYSIESALIESREKDIADTHEIAKAVLERIIE